MPYRKENARPRGQAKQNKQCVECGEPFSTYVATQSCCGQPCAARRRVAARELAAMEFVPITIGGGPAVVPLTKGRYALVDLEDYAAVARFNWHLHSDGSAARREYLGRKGGKESTRIVRMHQQLLPTEDGHEPDHRDLDRLNNRRSNLRVATSSQQKCNQRRRRDNASGHKGVCWDKSKGKWVAYVKKDGRLLLWKRFDRLEDAVAARRAVAIEAFGEFYRESA